jgi:asparagine synthase (glutamine-hydrolysing)
VCGIVAVWNRDGRPIDVAALRAGVQSLARRGPDGEGYLLVDTQRGVAVEASAHLLDSLGDRHFDLALGHRRLAIVDLSSAGHQPMGTEERDVWIVFNGMIYNFEELHARLLARGRRFRGRSDTEVLLASYLEWGPRFVDELNGMWALVIWDARSRMLLVSRDRLGIKPLIYHLSDTTAAFASEMKALAPLLPGSPEIDPQAVHHYLSLMQVPAPWTIDRRVRKLEAARNLEVGRENARESRYWSADAVASDAHTYGDDAAAERELEELLADSVRKELVADVPIGTLLSGGVDSSLVSALAADAKRPERLTTFSVTFPGLPDVDESVWARRVAERLGSEHVEIELRLDDVGLVDEILQLYDEPFAISSVLGVYLLAREASSRVKILLSGDGGDELFAGYERYLVIEDRWRERATRRFGRLDKERVAGIGQWVRWRPLAPATLARLAYESVRTTDAAGRDREFNRGRVMFNDVEKLALYSDAWRGAHRPASTIGWLTAATGVSHGTDPVLRRQLMEIHTSLPDEMLAKVDRATMAWGIEARVPLLDHRVAEHALRLSPALRYGGGEGKSVLKRIAAKHVPRDAIYRSKRGFTIPLAEWLRGGLREFVRDTLAPASVRRAGVFDPAAVAEVIAWYEREPDFHTAHMVFTLLAFHLWHEKIYEKF